MSGSISERRTTSFAALALLAVLAILAVFPLTGRLLERVDLLFYDLLLPVQSPAMSDDVVVIAIDDRSIRELGRWPWPRSTHADLVNSLDDMGARVIALDVLFADPDLDNPAADNALIEAIADANVVLPVAPVKQRGGGPIDELMPMIDLAVAAAGLGHVDVELDEDSLCRATFLFGGVGDARWPSLAQSMLVATGGTPLQRQTDASGDAQTGVWRRAERRLIPFTRPEDASTVISYSDIVTGRTPRQDIAGKYILVGATAAGLGDAISTPGARSHERMPGVLLNAQILNGLLQQQMISAMTLPAQIALSLSLIVVVAVAVVVLSTRIGLFTAGLGLVVVPIVSALALAFGRIWFPPASAFFAILLAWPLWTAWQYQRTKQLTAQLLLELDHQAKHRQSTGLPNQGMLLDQLRKLPESLLAGSKVSWLMVIHINWEGSASISLDHPSRDPILEAIRDRIRAIAPADSFIAHLESDDFAVLSSGFADIAMVRQAARVFLGELSLPMAYGSEHLLLAPQIGLSVWPDSDTDPENLLRNAYTAMFKTRIDSSDSLCIYSGSAVDKLQTRSQLEQALVFALEREEFSIYYQPQVDADGYRVVGAEALLRWSNPDLGWVSPSAFVPVAEHVGLISAIGSWVLEHACKQLVLWHEMGFSDLRMAINVSPVQFLVPGLEDRVESIIGEQGVVPDRLELEITESSVMQDIEAAIRVMRRIKDLGVELAIDDFGTGYSSLSNLRQFPLDRLKVDQAFTMEIGADQATERIADTIISMARHLDLQVVAEGVETEAQARFLQDQGANILQGFLFGKPMTAERFTELLQRQHSR